LKRLTDEAAATTLPALAPRALPPAVSGSTLPAQVSQSKPVFVTRNVRLNPTAVVSPEAAFEELKDWQRRVLEARLAILRMIDDLAFSLGAVEAIRHIVGMASRGELSPEIQSLVPIANARRGETGARTLSERSVYRWRTDLSKRGAAALAPRNTDRVEIPEWAPAFLSLFQQPQKPFLTEVSALLAQALPAEITIPSYWAIRRFLKRVNVVDLNRGRLGPREIRKIRIFVRRDFSMFLPGDIYEADGHTFDAEVAHPIHGRPFRPELELVLDVATRKAVGWSIGLAESTWTVLDALRNACETNCVPAIYYVDKGSGRNNHLMNDLSAGFFARLAIDKRHSIPYNSQARGAVERTHQTIFVALARTLATYMGKPMDQQARKNVFLVTREAARNRVQSPALISWNEFRKAVEAAIAAYNDRPHRSLPKFRNPETGKLRHQSPNERWAQLVEEGFEPVLISAQESADLFRPYEVRTVRRGEVSLGSNRYFHKALDGYHGRQVRVGYDLHDASRVWVRDLDGRLICIAGFEANSRAFFPVPMVEQKRQERAKGRERRLEAHLEEVRAELGEPNVLDAEYSADLTPEQAAAADEQLRALSAPPQGDEVELDPDILFWREAIKQPHLLTEDQREYLNARIERSPAFAQLIGIKDPDDGGFSCPSGLSAPAGW
jgi:putative transposase